MATRNAVKCPIFGMAEEIPKNVLPTKADVMRYYQWFRHNLKAGQNKKEPSFLQIVTPVARGIEKVWQNASIPVVSRKRIIQLIKNCHDKYMNLMKSYKARKTQNSFNEKLVTFRNSYNVLFDIASCKCDSSSCHCEKTRKIPKPEQQFLLDQRTQRKMRIGGIDLKATKKLQAKLQRKLKDSPLSKEVNETKSAISVEEPRASTSAFTEDELEWMEFPTPEMEDNSRKAANLPDSEHYSAESSKIVQPRIQKQLPNLARTCDRYGLSDRAAAAVASAVLQDFGIVTSENISNVIDRSKLRRERSKLRGEMSEESNLNPIKALYFDGRKDRTLNVTTLGNKKFKKTVTEEHISLIEEPSSKYIGHVVPTTGSAKHIYECIWHYFAEKELSVDHLLAIGCDGTVVNTGPVGGVICLFEKKLNKPLQWLVCQLHANELPLRHLLAHLDGPTSGPRAFSGPVGKALANCELQPVTTFEKIESELPQIQVEILSSDQRYLLEICQAVNSGICSESFGFRDPGKLAHSRWLTTANRILRLYVATELPSEELKTLAIFIMKVYAPMWFAIKLNSSCKYGAVHLWKTISLSRYLPQHLKCIIDPVIQRNAFFGHPENILLAMVADAKREIRELGLRRIVKSRQIILKKGVRKFQIPPLNFEAQSYSELIDWQTNLSAPPLLSTVTTEECMLAIKSSEVPILEFPDLPCHTQAVERCVRLVTEASASVCGAEARHGFIKARLAARQIMPKFNTKGEYRLA